ncbi:MAG TPA: hypothetical protein VEK56_08740 [Vicinamibacterales bacterium]|nr:hypothetical protein [Vicinamibacterales bacterium]
MRRYRRAIRVTLGVAAIALLLGGTARFLRPYRGTARPLPPPVEATVRAAGPGTGPPTWHDDRPKTKPKVITDAEREELLARAQVWHPPSVAIERVSFADDSRDPRVVRCRFRVTELGGTTPKFDCSLESGEHIRVKYGKTGEVPAEVASTRLLRALGFGSDYMQYVERLRCYGCPEEPFSVMKAVEITQAEKLYKSLMVSYDDYEDFEWAAIETKFEGRELETDRLAGWAMFELDKVRADAGGAPRAHVDALRLLSVFLAHWDNKADNQRLVCLSQSDWQKGETCRQPFLLLQDLGSTFGPAKVNLEGWTNAPIWENRAMCLTSMRKLPFDGATFGEAHISEQGRHFLADMLTRFTDRQLTDLFTTSRFDDPLGIFRRSSAVADWVRAFKVRVRQIADGPPCPSET